MTRRSFCFLFGAGLAVAALPMPVWATDTPADVSTASDISISICESLYVPTSIMFHTQDMTLRVGRTITYSFPHRESLPAFNGSGLMPCC